ncbi:F-box/kelch-repeat protein At3g06240-like [Salvia miltiorrhiza]|uniref:F-box/kelch-repeat protein At3g06240-like n=1 Tax=Salvia miltiorrhiza TaxID=226208 RepID=UPI0025AC53DE|nr:F-box/kelch-repeat protein At3g06240-like [Salvia miltiorrhiza]XP_057793505.1 F-box/kelch-repeat protein At3g06240-like [Salvia miltiorrhiza]XP_057793506.1 F-box/kelch-repeat protein At3g06240-like [Salvia miltiorrhiza]
MKRKMKRDFFTYLPSEVIINILSRLPIRTIARSKCVCKPWLHLLETDEFVSSHHAESVPTLVVLTPFWTHNPFSFFEYEYVRRETRCESHTMVDRQSLCTVYEFEDDHNLKQRDLQYNQLTRFYFPHRVEIMGSANGLLFLSKQSEVHYVCNPITREYVEVHFPEELIQPCPEDEEDEVDPEILEEPVYDDHQSVTYGFGVSKITGKHKVVRISHGFVTDQGGRRIIPKSVCHVHTLGTGSWRHVESGAPFEYSERTSCVFLNGTLHWIVSDSYSKLWISCFDLEEERFRTFSTPPIYDESHDLLAGLSTLGDCLCLCDNTGEDGETVIWLMKEYGINKSWTKEHVIYINEDLLMDGSELVYPLKVVKNGDILMLRESSQLVYYSSKTFIAEPLHFPDEDSDEDPNSDPVYSILLTPSFLSLKSLKMDNLFSF